MARALFGSYQLGTVAFTLGTGVWGYQTYAASGRLDLAALAYGIGCLFFLDDAHAAACGTSAVAKPSTPDRPSWLARLRPSSYQAGSLAYALGTAIWATDVYAQSATLDPAAALYAIGCALFVYDGYRRLVESASSRLARVIVRGLANVPLRANQLGSLTFLLGTVAWAVGGGISAPVVAYGIGCLFYVRDAFRKPGCPHQVGVRPGTPVPG